MTKPGGWLLVSGILLSDEKTVTDAALAAGYTLSWFGSRGNWLCGLFLRRVGE
jgi:ribosomal protein L11 methylase PrmA